MSDDKGDSINALSQILSIYEKCLELLTISSIEVGETHGMTKEEVIFFLSSITLSLGAAIAADRDLAAGNDDAHKVMDEMYATTRAMMVGEAINPVTSDRVH